VPQCPIAGDANGVGGTVTVPNIPKMTVAGCLEYYFFRRRYNLVSLHSVLVPLRDESIITKNLQCNIYAKSN